MESFSGYLKSYLSKHNLKVSQAAKMTGIERSSLSRYCNGIKNPRNMEVVSKLAEGLQMQKAERKELECAYRRMKIAEQHGVFDTTLMAVVHSGCIKEQPREGKRFDSPKAYTKESAWNLQGESKVLEALAYVLKDAEYAMLHFTPKDIQKAELLKWVFADMETIKTWEQILCFSYRDWKHSQERMQTLDDLLPYLYKEQKVSIYYHYQSENAADRQQWKSQYLLTDKGIVFFDKKLEEGFFSSHRVPCQFYKELFQREKMHCIAFAEGGRQQFLESEHWQADFVYENTETGIVFLGQKEAGCIWLVHESKQAVCIQDAETVQVLWKYIWETV